MIRIKRVYEEPAPADGFRILVDRLWPRGVSKNKAQIDLWLKDLAPGTDLRAWFGHDPAKWDAFKHRYFRELEAADADSGTLGILVGHARSGPVTLVYAAKDERYNNAVALQEYLQTRYNL
jgi:uncharacterized protein YeaO (DUF488 family)